MPDNILYYGDNLKVLREHVKDDTVDLVYLDPPFNSNATYNVLFAEKNGSEAAAQVKAFGDTWHWDENAARTYEEVVERGGRVSQAMQAFKLFLGVKDRGNDMLAYLTMMAPRLVELRHVLKPTGSIYLHCDPTASHCLRLLMDAVFGGQNFRTEIVWKRQSAHSDARQGRRQHGRIHDAILFYSMSDEWTWNHVYTPYDERYVDSAYKHTEVETGRRYSLGDLTGPGGAAKGNPRYEFLGVTRYWRYSRERMQELHRQGRIVQTKPGAVPTQKRYLDEMPGIALQDIWMDIKPIAAAAAERLGYPTQKPEALLERIITASSNEGDTVLDPFCGCGTAVVVAHKLKRKWIGIDITHLATNLIRTRLDDTFGEEVRKTYRVIGEPETVYDAEQLARDDPWQFQLWALSRIPHARPSDKKGADRGIDGVLYFHDETAKGGATKQIIFSVKGGKTSSPHVDQLLGVVESEKAEIGVLVSLQEPTKPMREKAASAGFYESPWGKHSRIQLITVAELLEGKRVSYPYTRGIETTFKRAPKHNPGNGAEQMNFIDDQT